MAIRRIRISNFKSFKDLEIELGDFNVLIGANASGKSNFIELFRFIRDIRNHGLENAISRQGNVKYFRNVALGSSSDFRLEITSDLPYRYVREKDDDLFGIELNQVNYKLILKFKDRGFDYTIQDDRLTQKYKFVRIDPDKNNKEDIIKDLGKGIINVSVVNKKRTINFDCKISPKNIPISEEDIFPQLFKMIKELEPKMPILESPIFDVPRITGAFSDPIPGPFTVAPGFRINDFQPKIFDFDPRIAKKPMAIAGPVDLSEDGSNLALVLKDLLRNKHNRRKFSNLINDILPFIVEMDVEMHGEKSIYLRIREKYPKLKKERMPAFAISDGTVNVAALIVALFFEDSSLTIIEEPERNVHPYLISKIVDMMKDASQKKQVITTTHNPEIVKYAGLDNILLISRDKNGFSTITRPAHQKEIKAFLKHDLGIDDLFIKDMLRL